MGWTGGAGSSFQKECNVDFCGFEMAKVDCWLDREWDVGAMISRWLRCAEKSLFRVFSE